MRKIAAFPTAIAFVACCNAGAYAQDSTEYQEPANGLPVGCQGLENNEAWTKEFTQLTANYKANEYQAALKNAEVLNTICDRSPILNFSIGRIYRELGDDIKGLYFMQRATMFTEEFLVRGELLERMWYERYEVEHADAREENIAKRKKQIEELQAENEQLKAGIQQRDTEMLEYKAQTALDRNTALLNERSHYAAGLWSGVGIGGLGVVLAVTGGALMYKEKDNAVEFSDSERKAWPKTMTYLYTSMFAAGIGMAVAGAVVSGIMGYYYARLPSTQDEPALAVSPAGLSLNF